LQSIFILSLAHNNGVLFILSSVKKIRYWHGRHVNYNTRTHIDNRSVSIVISCVSSFCVSEVRLSKPKRNHRDHRSNES